LFLNSQCAKPKLVDPMENERRETLAGLIAAGGTITTCVWGGGKKEITQGENERCVVLLQMICVRCAAVRDRRSEDRRKCLRCWRRR